MQPQYIRYDCVTQSPLLLYLGDQEEELYEGEEGDDTGEEEEA
jgi:hypothetical protein